MSIYTNKRFVKQAAVLKKKQQHDETWATLCSQVKESEQKEKQREQQSQKEEHKQ